MRNLKRVLSLALAALMLMGMMVIGAGAASKDFTDASEIKNVEAVDVMVALGVLEGGNNGDFQPNSILTREQAAKIICYMLLGEEAAEKLTTNYSIFSDVPANRWSAPYISYCVNLGILAGDGAGHFFPEGKLTGVAFAKMLMVCLGYSAEREHYVGNNWEINTSAAAIAAGVAPKALDLSKELSRQDAAQMAYNTLKGTMVEYLNDNTIIIGGQTVVSTVGKASAVAQGVYDNNMRADYLQFAEKYFPYLILTQGMTDDFGRPAHIWTYKNKDIGTYTDNDLLVAEYTDTVKGKEAYTDIGYSAISKYDLKVYVDGAVCKDITKANLSSSNSSALAHTGRGVLTQIYVDHATKQISVVVINTYLAKVTADYNTKTETLPVVIYTGINTGATSTSTPATTSIGKTLSLSDFSNLSTFKKDTFVKVTMAASSHIDCAASPLYSKYNVKSIDAAESVSNVVLNSYTMTEDNTSNINTYRLDTMTAEGTKYSAAEKAYFDASVLYNYNQDRDQLKDCVYNLYMDNYGNVLGIELVESPDNYVFVVGYEVGYSPIAESVDQALVITTDGTMKVVNVRDDKAQVWSNAANSGKGGWVDMTDFSSNNNKDTNAAVNKWFTYTMDENGTYILNKVAYYQGAVNSATRSASGADISGVYADLTTNNTNKNGTVDEAKVRPVAYGNNNSVYIAVAADAKTVNGGGSIVKVNGVSTGIKNTNIESTDVSEMTNFTNDYNTFFLYNSNGYVTYAVVVGEDMTSSDNMAFFATGATGRYYDSTLKGYYVTYDVIMGNQLQTVKVLDATATAANPARGDLFKATINADGYISALTGYAANDEYRDTGDINMNTTDYKTSGYAQTSGMATSPVKVQLVGATLWIKNATLADGRYVVINNDAKVFVKVGSESKYEQYNDIESALSVLANDGSAYISRVTAICDKTTGYATTLIITETKGASSTTNLVGGAEEGVTSVVATGLNTGTVSINDRLNYGKDAAKLAAEDAVAAIENAGYKVLQQPVSDGRGEYYIYAQAGSGAVVTFTTVTTDYELLTISSTIADTQVSSATQMWATDNGTFTVKLSRPSGSAFAHNTYTSAGVDNGTASNIMTTDATNTVLQMTIKVTNASSNVVIKSVTR